LRVRRDDIPHLIRHFVETKTKELGVQPRELAPATIDRLIAYPWPGNVRELENVVERLLVLAGGGPVIGPEALPSDLDRRPGEAGAPDREAVLLGRKSLADAVDAFERDIIGEALEQTYFNQTRAAEMLGTTRRILKYRMDKLGINCPEP
jgi:two-component system response regulator AtoC